MFKLFSKVFERTLKDIGMAFKCILKAFERPCKGQPLNIFKQPLKDLVKAFTRPLKGVVKADRRPLKAFNGLSKGL